MPMSDSSADRDPLDRLAEEFVARYRAGQRPALTEFVERLPDRAEEIRDLFPALVEMEQLKPASADLTGDFAPAPEPADPVRIGEFRILRPVGRGGMGVVYEAVQESLGRHVALKLLPAEALADPKRLERFRREAKAAARLHHTNIVPVFGTGEADGRHYYAMQFIDGHPLDAVIDEVRRLKMKSAGAAGRPVSEVAQALLTGAFVPTGPDEAQAAPAAPGAALPASVPAVSGSLSDGGRHYWDEVARLGAQAADALAYAHAQGILHRDVKPANLLLDLRGTLWVTDFGLAKATDADDLTHAGDVVGTLRYLAPERFDGQGDHRADLYALGLTLYELLTLQPAFTADNRAKLVERVLEASPPRPRSVNPSIPRDLETIVLKATARDPAMRYASARELAEDLRRYLEDRPILARRASSTEQAWRWCRRNPAVASLLTAVLLLFATGASLSLFFGLGAREQAREAEVARKQAKKEQERTSRLLYVSQINLAATALADERIPRLRQLLDEMIPKPGEQDLRGWEWHYLNNLTRVPIRHEFVIHGEQPNLSRDGRWVTVLRHAGENCAFDVWDVRDGRLLATLPKAGSPPIPWIDDGYADAQVSPDGSVLAVGFGPRGSERVSLHLWRLDTGEALPGPKELPLDFRYENQFVLGPGAAWVAWEELPPKQSRNMRGVIPSGPDGIEKTVARWERSTGSINRKHFRTQCGSGENGELAADGETVYCGTNSYSQSAMAGPTATDREQRLEAWDLTTDPPSPRWPSVRLPTLRASANSFVESKFSPGRTSLAVLNHRKELTVYRLSDGKALWQAPASDWSPSTTAFLVGVSDDGSRVLLRVASVCFVLERSGNADNATVRRLTFRRRFQVDPAFGLAGKPTSRYSPDGRTFIHLERSDADWVVREIDVSTDPELVQAPPGNGVTIEELESWNAPGAKMIVLRNSIGTETARVEPPPGGIIETAALASGDRRLLVSMRLEPPEDFRKRGGGLWDGSRWTLYELDGGGRIRQIAEGKGQATLAKDTQWFVVGSNLSFSSPGNFAIHHLATGDCLRQVGGQAEPDSSSFAGFSPSGNSYAVVSVPPRQDKPTRPEVFAPVVRERIKVTLRLMETATGKELWTAAIGDTVLHYGGQVVFSPDGKRICACVDGTEGASPVRVLRLEDGSLERLLEVFETNKKRAVFISMKGGGIAGLDVKMAPRLHGFTPDGRLILGKEDAVQLWNLETGVCESNLRGNGRHTMWTHVSADGGRLFVYCLDSTCRLHVWDLNTGRQLLELPCGDAHLFMVRIKWEAVGNKLFVQQENGFRVFDGTPATP